MSVMPWRAIMKKKGEVPTVRSASQAARRLTRRASISQVSVRPMTAKRTKGRRIASTTVGDEVISPEKPPSSPWPSARNDVAMSQKVKTGLERKPSFCQSVWTQS